MNTSSLSQSNQPGERLRQAAEALGTELAPVNFVAVAIAAGVPRQVLSELIHGKRPLTRYYAEKLAPVVKVTESWLLGGDE